MKQVLREVMEQQHAAFMALAGRVATIHEEVDVIRDEFLRDLNDRQGHGQGGAGDDRSLRGYGEKSIYIQCSEKKCTLRNE